MQIKTFVEGPIGANNYLVIDEKTRDAVLIDCSSSRDGFIQEIKNSNVNLRHIFLTHGHFDHILGCDGFVKEFGVDVYVGEDDVEQIKYAPEMVMMLTGRVMDEVKTFFKTVKQGDEFKVGDMNIKVISTPGHTPGGMCYLIDGKLFSGDTLFCGSVGRCDFKGGNLTEIIYSVKEKLFKLPDNTEVYTGHGDKTTIGYEKQFNEIINY